MSHMNEGHEFAALVDQHYAPLYRFALALARSEATAADLTQQTFYLFASKGHQLRDITKAKCWLFTTLRREFFALHRRASHYPESDVDGEIETLPEPPPPDPARFDSAALLDALAQMDAVHRAPLTLFYLQEFSYREIAEVLEIPAGTVMSRLSRGKAELRRLLLERERHEEGHDKIIPLDSKRVEGEGHE